MPLDQNLTQGTQGPSSSKYGLGWFIPHQRSIGSIVADVTIEEDERDEVTVTEHPVEQGAPIADHAFKRQEEVTLRVGWNIQKTGDLSAESGMYGILLNWQAALMPFDLYTGKRRHKNMLITGIHVITDQTTEYSLMAQVNCKEIILTKTQKSQTGVSGNPGDHASPEASAPEQDAGTQETTEVPNTSSIDKITKLDVPNTSAIDSGKVKPQ